MPASAVRSPVPVTSMRSDPDPFTATMDALHARAQQEPNNPEAYYTISTYYWEKAYRDFTTPQPDKVKFVQQGLEELGTPDLADSESTELARLDAMLTGLWPKARRGADCASAMTPVPGLATSA